MPGSNTPRDRVQDQATAPTNQKPEYTLDELAEFFVGEVTDYQHQPKTRAATSIDRSRQRELRRQLVRKDL